MTNLPRRIETRRLRLDATCSAHADAIHRAVRATLSELQPWMPWARDPSPDEQLAFATHAERQWEACLSWNFTIFLENEVIGSIGLANYQPLIKTCDLGYWIRTDCAGRGYMTEAGTAVIEFAFDRLEMHRIQLLAAVGNRASQRVAEKLGFHSEGIQRDGSKGAFEWHDTYMLGLVSSDPRPKS
ncbi:MAG: GNAT family N-acetyltransferase [Actinobacteria bacterium]|nr:GNAT family N-acetyltransferase [Actinomycetota bacterium]